MNQYNSVPVVALCQRILGEPCLLTPTTLQSREHPDAASQDPSRICRASVTVEPDSIQTERSPDVTLCQSTPPGDPSRRKRPVPTAFQSREHAGSHDHESISDRTTVAPLSTQFDT